MFDDRDGNVWGKIPDGTPSGIRIHKIVIAHGLAAELLCMRETIPVQRIEIQSGLLMRIFTVSKLV